MRQLTTEVRNRLQLAEDEKRKKKPHSSIFFKTKPLGQLLYELKYANKTKENALA